MEFHGIPKLGLEMLFISQAKTNFSQFKILGSSKSEFVFREMENRGQSFSVLNCIDLSCPDIHKSVSLLKQVRFVSKLLRLVAEKGERRKGEREENFLIVVCALWFRHVWILDSSM